MALTIPPGQEEVARAFYGGTLGLEEVEKPEVVRKNGGLWFEVGDLQLHLAAEPAHALVHGIRRYHVGLVVPDLQEAREVFRRRGAEVFEQPDLPEWSRFYVQDPFGNRLELQARRAGART